VPTVGHHPFRGLSGGDPIVHGENRTYGAPKPRAQDTLRLAKAGRDAGQVTGQVT